MMVGDTTIYVRKPKVSIKRHKDLIKINGHKITPYYGSGGPNVAKLRALSSLRPLPARWRCFMVRRDQVRRHGLSGVIGVAASTEREVLSVHRVSRQPAQAV